MALIGYGGGSPTSELARQIYFYNMGTNTGVASTSFNMSSIDSNAYVFVYSGKKGNVTLPTSLHTVFINEDGTLGADHTENGTVDLSSYMGALIGVYRYSGTITYSET